MIAEAISHIGFKIYFFAKLRSSSTSKSCSDSFNRIVTIEGIYWSNFIFSHYFITKKYDLSNVHGSSERWHFLDTVNNGIGAFFRLGKLLVSVSFPVFLVSQICTVQCYNV